MHYSTESQIHINPASRENLSFISDRNLRKGQGTAPPGLHNYAVIIVLSHASPEPYPLCSAGMKWCCHQAATTFPRLRVRQARANPTKCFQLLHFRKLLEDFAIKRVGKLAFVF